MKRSTAKKSEKLNNDPAIKKEIKFSSSSFKMFWKRGGEEARKVRFRWRVRISGHRASNFLIETHAGAGRKFMRHSAQPIYRSDGMIVVDWSQCWDACTTRVFDYRPLDYAVFEERSVIPRWNSKFNFVQIDIPRRERERNFYLSRNFFVIFFFFF